MIRYSIFLTFLCATAFANAQNFHDANGPAINSNSEGIFMEGYDLVSYFNGSPQIGLTDFKYVHENVTFQFANKENLDMFQADPAQYLPQYGGWCAIGICFEVVDSSYPSGKYKVDPLNYEIYENRLYFFYPENEFAAKSLWSSNKNLFISKADSVWQHLDK